MRYRLPLLLTILLVTACSRGGDGSPAGVTASPSAVSVDAHTTAIMTWRIGDGCSDGRGLQFRLFDVTNGFVYPSSRRVFTVSPGRTVAVSIRCPRGAQICYGARTRPDDGGFWGIDLDGLEGCDTCCATCGRRTVGVRLVNSGVHTSTVPLLSSRERFRLNLFQGPGGDVDETDGH